LGSESVLIYRTEDGGRRWHLTSETGPTTSSEGAVPFGCDKSIHFVSTNVGWAMFQCNGGLAPIYETHNGGASWVKRGVKAPVFSFESGGFAGAPELTGDRGAVGYTFQVGNGSVRKSVVYMSTDAGASWRPTIPPGRPVGWIVDAITPLRWRLVSGDNILATDDGGLTWRTISSNVSLNPLYDDTAGSQTVDFATAEVGWVVSTSSTGTRSLWRTTDGGSIWSSVPVPGG
jgi:photosystem II stability/assembly factor-like uncharacterized protein